MPFFRYINIILMNETVQSLASESKELIEKIHD